MNNKTETNTNIKEQLFVGTPSKVIKKLPIDINTTQQRSQTSPIRTQSHSREFPSSRISRESYPKEPKQTAIKTQKKNIPKTQIKLKQNRFDSLGQMETEECSCTANNKKHKQN